MDKPSRFTATPSEIHAWIQDNFADDVHLRYQQAIAFDVLSEAVGDVQAVRAQADNEGLYNADWREGWDDYNDRIDPERNDPYPSSLINL